MLHFKLVKTTPVIILSTLKFALKREWQISFEASTFISGIRNHVHCTCTTATYWCDCFLVMDLLIIWQSEFHRRCTHQLWVRKFEANAILSYWSSATKKIQITDNNFMVYFFHSPLFVIWNVWLAAQPTVLSFFKGLGNCQKNIFMGKFGVLREGLKKVASIATTSLKFKLPILCWARGLKIASYVVYLPWNIGIWCVVNFSW